jgi:putative phosphoesterase
VRLLMVADTHVPKRARDLPAQVWDEVDRADVVLHAGDWVDLETFERLEQRARRLVAVHGNNDGPALRARMPEVAEVDLGGLRFAMIHDSGPAARRPERLAAAFPSADVVVFGHSHIPWDTQEPGGPRLLNPGSPTDRRRQPACTYLTATVVPADTGGDVARLIDVVLHRLPQRPSGRGASLRPSTAERGSGTDGTSQPA